MNIRAETQGNRQHCTDLHPAAIPRLQSHCTSGRELRRTHLRDEAYYFGFQLPSYTIANGRVSISTDKWTASVFCDNLTNKMAELTANNTSLQFNVPQLVRITTNQPRTYGTQVSYKF